MKARTGIDALSVAEVREGIVGILSTIEAAMYEGCLPDGARSALSLVRSLVEELPVGVETDDALSRRWADRQEPIAVDAAFRSDG